MKDNKKDMYKDLAILRRDVHAHFAKPENRPIEFTDEQGNTFLKGFSKDNISWTMPLHTPIYPPRGEVVPSDVDPAAQSPFGID